MNLKIGIIGGTGLTSLQGLDITEKKSIQTPFGEPSDKLITGHYSGHDILFLPRHGSEHSIPPHKVNYRANIWTLQNAGVTHVIAVNAVGGISANLHSGSLVIPEQLIDYTWGRSHTFYEDGLDDVVHIDFTEPYCQFLRNNLYQASIQAELYVVNSGIYAAVQGPRLETAAEINRLDKDGCTIVGMTGMPEAGLAKELGLCYACIALVVNPAAGRGEGEITMEEIETSINSGMGDVRKILTQTISLLHGVD